MRKNRVNIPAVTSLKTALEIYYTKIQLNNADVAELFGNHAQSTISALKKVARDYMTENKIMLYNSRDVNTKAAYAAWGIDIAEIERRYKKSKEIERV